MKKLSILMVLLAFLIAPSLVFAQDEQAEDQTEEQVEEEVTEELGAEEQVEVETEQEAVVEEQPEEAEQPAGAVQLGAEGSKLPGAYMAISDLAGAALVNNAGEQVGTLQDVFLTSDGNVSHVIGSVDNFPGIPSGNYLLQPDWLEISNQQVTLSLPGDATLNRLEGAKTAGIVAMDSVRASQLMNYSLVNQDGQSIGRIEDVVINLEDGTVQYAAVNFAELLGAGEQLHAVPYMDVWYNLNQQTVTLYNIDPQVLGQKEGFAPDDTWPVAGDPSWNTLQ